MKNRPVRFYHKATPTVVSFAAIATFTFFSSVVPTPFAVMPDVAEAQVRPFIGGDTPEAAEQYKYALGLIQRQLYDEAATVLRRVLADATPFSKRDGAWFWLGESLSRVGKQTDAIAAYERGLREFKSSSLADRMAYGLGWAYARDNNPKSAVEAFARVSRKDRSLFIDARLKMGYLMVKFAMDPAKTTAVYEELLSLPNLPADKCSEAHFQAGAQHFSQGQFADAAKQFKASLDTASETARPPIMFSLAEAQFRDTKFTAAEQYYREVLAASSTVELMDKSSYGLAWCRIKSGKPEEAVAPLSRLADSPTAINRIEALKNLIDLQMNLRKYPDAIRRMEHAAALFPPEDAIEMEYMRGLALSRTGEFPKALDVFKSFIKSHPGHTRTEDARYQTGLVHISMGKFREALTDLDPLLRRETGPSVREKALYRTGECFFNLGNMKNARDAFERLRREYPEGSTKLDALYQLGEIEYASGNAAGALQAFNSLAKTDGEIAGQAAFRCGEVLMKAERFLDAVAAFDEYLAKFPSGALREDARFKEGLCQLELKDPGKALAAFSELRESKGYFRQEARFQIGEIAQKLGNFPMAIQQYKAILAEEPGNPLASRARRAIGICLFSSKDFPAAEETFKAILKEYPATDVAIPESRLWLGRAILAQGHREDGILEVLKVPVLYPKSPLIAEAYAEAARACDAAKLKSRSEKLWHEVLKFKTSGPLADEAHTALKSSGSVK
ncbi:MAG: tetratricopeptide repeat protein [Candidatus Riflebacteria bacterium]|nr:tetratricopeptide repeat protein [Candidatus Riflebacteria bacterium]